jgi:nucleoside-diphosphate-sugar epimerase
VAGFEGLPQYTDGRALRRPRRRFRQGRVLVTGAAGIIGTVVANHLGDDLRLVGLDVSKSPVRRQFDRFRVGSVADRELLTRLARRCETVLHLATGAARGWDGLLEVEINGTRNVLDAAMAAGCRRVVLASSIHAAGWDVVDARANGGPRRPPPSAADPARPSGLYAVGKVTAEALGRACAEWSGLGVSAIRFGTVQPDDDLARAAHGRGFRNLGPDPATVEQNLRLSWCHHTDLVRIVREELAATEPFRICYGTSRLRDPVWSDVPYSWSPEGAA